MKYYFLLLVVSVLFLKCKEWEKGGEPPAQTFSLKRFHETVRSMDSTSAMFRFRADTGAIDFTTNMLQVVHPEPPLGLNGNIAAAMETVLTPKTRDRSEETFTREYEFENGRPARFAYNDPADSLIQTMQYDAKGLLVENKKVWPEEDNALVMEYQYDAENKLIKVLYFNNVDLLIRTSHFFYHKNGNLDSIFFEDTEGEDYSYKYYTNSKSKSYLQVRISEKGAILSADFFELDDRNQVTYEEEYQKDEGAYIASSKFEYDSYGDMKKLEVSSSMDRSKSLLTHSYTKRDAAGNWIEMLTYVDRDLYQITRRVITYK